MRERGRYWSVVTIVPILLGLFLATAAGAAPSDQVPTAVPTATPTLTPTSTPTGIVGVATATSTLAVPGVATATPTVIASAPAGTPTSTVAGPTNLQVKSSGPQPGMYTVGWTPPVGMTIAENRVQSVPVSGTPEILARVPGNQSSAVVRADPRIGYALAVVAVDSSNRVSAPSNTVSTAGAPTATPIPPPPTPNGMTPYGAGMVPGATGPLPANGAYGAAPYTGTYGSSPYPGGYPSAPYGSVPGPYGAPGYGAQGYGAPGYGAPGYGAPGYGAPGYGVPGYGAPAYGPSGYPGTLGYPSTVGAGAAQWWCTPVGGTAVAALGQTRPASGYTNCTYHP